MKTRPKVFKKHFIGNESNKSFDDLTLNEYIQLLLHESKWPYFSAIFLLEQVAVRRLLNSVRDTRNNLFHFRGEITSEQRQQLRDSKDWLARCLHTLTPGEYRATTSPEPIDELAAASDLQLSDTPEEVRGQDESRYALLASYLQERPLSEDKQALTFKQIEEIIREELPASARQHPSWWTNEGMDHNPSQQWLDVGWTVSLIDAIEERVIFTRIKERERAYADFFTVLLSELQQLRPFPIRNPSPSGKSYLVIAGVPEVGKRVALLAFSFARYKRFRVELYIDEKEGDKERNKHMFDVLYSHKNEIEKDLNEIVHWERIDDKRASRIALYRAGAITDSEEDLAKLRKWAVDAMIRFQKVMEQYASSVLSIH